MPPKTIRVTHDSNARAKFQEWSEGCVKPATVQTYRATVQQMSALGYSLDFEGLADMIMNDADPVSVARLRVTKSALKWYLAAQQPFPTGLERPTALFSDWQEETLERLLRTRALREPARPSRGAITADLLDDLLKYLETRGVAYPLRWQIEIVWACALRTNQAATVRRDQFFKKDGRWWLRLTEQHLGRNAPAITPKQLDHWVHDRVQVRLSGWLALMKDEQLVCPHWSDVTVNNLIHAAARDLKWSEELMWDGAHCLRHGGATSTAEEFGVETARKLTRHKAKAAPIGVLKTYLEPNDGRIQRLRVKSAQRGGAGKNAAPAKGSRQKQKAAARQ